MSFRFHRDQSMPEPYLVRRASQGEPEELREVEDGNAIGTMGDLRPPAEDVEIALAERTDGDDAVGAAVAAPSR